MAFTVRVGEGSGVVAAVNHPQGLRLTGRFVKIQGLAVLANAIARSSDEERRGRSDLAPEKRTPQLPDSADYYEAVDQDGLETLCFIVSKNDISEALTNLLDIIAVCQGSCHLKVFI